MSTISEFKEKLEEYVSGQMEIATLRQLQEFLRGFIPTDAREAQKHITCEDGNTSYTVRTDIIQKVEARLAGDIEKIEKELEGI